MTEPQARRRRTDPAPALPISTHIEDNTSTLVPGLYIHRRDDQLGPLEQPTKPGNPPDAEFAATLGRALAQAMSGQPGHRLKRTSPRPRNAPEVTRYTSQLTIKGQESQCAFWQVSWKDAQGKTWTRKFSVNLWGEETAHQKALRIDAHQRIARI